MKLFLLRSVLGCLLSGLPAPMIFAADQAAGAAASEPAVRMRPFKVFAEWMEVQPVLRKGLIEWVRIASVLPGSPPARAGLKPGMKMIEVQGVSPVGLTEDEFSRRLGALAMTDRLTIKILGATGNAVTPFTIVLSGENAGGATAPAAADPKPPAEPAPLAEMSEAEVRKRLAAAQRAVDTELDRVRAEARATGQAATDTRLLQQIGRELAQIPPAHLALLCEAAVKADDKPGILRNTLVIAIIGRTDYAAEQKAIVLKYLPQLPDLIVVLDKMHWMEGTQAVLVAGWRKARENERDGMLDSRSSRYARLAAGQGVLDALIAIAKTAREPRAAARMSGRLLAQEIEALKKLVPLEKGDAASLAEFVLKNKERLVFDPAKGTYALGR